MIGAYGLGLGCTPGRFSDFPQTANPPNKNAFECNARTAPRYYGMDTMNIWRSNLERKGGAHLARAGRQRASRPGSRHNQRK